MNNLMFLRDQVVNLFGLLSNSANGAARAKGIVDGTGVVVAKLHDDVIATSYFRKHIFPASLYLIGSAAASTAGVVFDVDFCRIELFMKKISPAPKSFVTIATSVLYCG